MFSWNRNSKSYWLQKYGDLYRREGIKFDEHREYSDDDSSDNDAQASNSSKDIPGNDQTVDKLTHKSTHVDTGISDCPDDEASVASDHYDDGNKTVEYDGALPTNDDQWSEIDEAEERAGITDALLTQADFVEDNERDHVYSVAPAEGNHPLSIFKDKYWKLNGEWANFCKKQQKKLGMGMKIYDNKSAILETSSWIVLK